MFSVSLPLPAKIYPDIQPVIEVKRKEQKLPKVDLDQIRQPHSQPLPERDDDWFVLFEAVREEAVIRPSGIHFAFAPLATELPLSLSFKVEHL